MIYFGMFATQIYDLVTFLTATYAILCTKIGLRLEPGRRCLSLIPWNWLLALVWTLGKGTESFWHRLS
jgi:hypothetical protein